MTSPPTRISAGAVPNPVLAKVFTEELEKGLNAAATDREEATPEPVYSTDDVESPFQYLAQLQRDHFTSREAEKIRQRITDTEYWKCEAKFFEDTVEMLWGQPRMEAWRSRTKGYKSLLVQIGLTTKEIEQLRFSIRAQPYWELEADFFKQESNRREYQLKMRWKTREDQRQRRVALRSMRTKQSCSSSSMQAADRVSSRTRSKTPSGGVIKRVTDC